jgi:hypothetical protein
LSLSHDQPLYRKEEKGYVKPYWHNMMRCLNKKMIMAQIIKMKARRIKNTNAVLVQPAEKEKRES